MTRQEVFDYVAARYGTEPDYPWMDENAVLRHAENAKWYGVVLSVRRDRLGLSGEECIDVLNVKCDPLLLGSLRMQEGFHPAYHMNKEKWISMRLDGSVPRDVVEGLLELSHSLTAPRPKSSRKGCPHNSITENA